jgi:hypothetical protein
VIDERVLAVKPALEEAIKDRSALLGVRPLKWATKS